MSDGGDRPGDVGKPSQPADSIPALPQGSDLSVRKGVEQRILHDETDGRRRHEWLSAYPLKAKVQIWCETAFVSLVLVSSLVGIYLIWHGYLVDLLACKTCSTGTLKRYGYFFFSGMLGSILFGGKYLYRVVARGYWHQDRRLWRVLSPFLSASLALMVAAAVDSGMLGVSFRAGSHAACVALGFFSGYFADKALAKMSEVADVVFGVRELGQSSGKHESKARQENAPS